MFFDQSKKSWIDQKRHCPEDLCFWAIEITHSAITTHPLPFQNLLTCHYICLYICAGSPDVTSLTFDVRSTTLTCTSTGGPATTVTWRKDGIVITLNTTHQQTKRLVDSVNGTYQTVLTIDPSVGFSGIVGKYNCTVKNTRGGSSITVDVKGKDWHFVA